MGTPGWKIISFQLSLKAGTLLITFFRICLVLNVQQLLCATSSDVRLLPWDFFFSMYPSHVSMSANSHPVIVQHWQFLPSSLLSACPQLALLVVVLSVYIRRGAGQGQGLWVWAQHEFSVPIPETAFLAGLQMSIQPLSHPTLARTGKK